MTPKESYHHGDLRQALVDAGLALLADSGPSGLSLRGVARKAGVSPAAPYHHFANKSELLAAIGAEGFELLEEELREARATAGCELGEDLSACGSAYVRFALAHPAHFRVMFRAEDGPKHPLVEAASAPVFQLLVDGVSACQAAGEGPAIDPRALSLLCWSTVHGIAMLLLDGPASRWHKLGLGLSREALGALVARSLSDVLVAAGKSATDADEA